MLNTEKINKLKYSILPGRCQLDSSSVRLHNQSFIFWKEFWNEVFRQNGANHSVNCDQFSRQTAITVLSSENEIAGLHLYTEFNLNSIANLEHSYFLNSFNSKYMDFLKQKKMQSVLSIEYLTVSPNWRKKELGISLGEVIMGLSTKYLLHSNCQASIAPSRSDVGVTKMVCDLGGEVVVPDLIMHNTPIDLIVMQKEKIKPHPNDVVNDYVNYFWSSREDFINKNKTTNRGVYNEQFAS